MSEPEARDAIGLYQPGDFIILAMAKVASQRLSEENLDAFRRSISVTQARYANDYYLKVWNELIDLGPEAIREVLTETTERGQVLRSCVSLRAFVTKEERDQIFAEHMQLGKNDRLA